VEQMVLCTGVDREAFRGGRQTDAYGARSNYCILNGSCCMYGVLIRDASQVSADSTDHRLCRLRRPWLVQVRTCAWRLSVLRAFPLASGSHRIEVVTCP
jgi:hypothetical protein